MHTGKNDQHTTATEILEKQINEKIDEKCDGESDDEIEEKRPIEPEISSDDPVDIIQKQQMFYDQFEHHTMSNPDTYGYINVLNEEVLKEVIESGFKLKLYDNSSDELNSFANILWEQKKFTGTEHLKIIQLLVICVHDSKNVLSYPLDIKSKEFSIHPIYRIPKCFHKNDIKHGKCCAIFVDQFARVYKSWDNFMNDNKFGDCLIVAPKDGFYSSNVQKKVNLDIFSQKEGVLKVFDTTSALGGFAAAGVTLVGLIPAVTLAPVVATGALVAGKIFIHFDFH